MARAMLLSFAEEMRMRRPLERRRIRDHSDPFQLPEHEFIRYFRLTKTAFLQFYQEINVYLSPARRRTAIRNELKVLAVLSFFAQGSYQRSVGSSYLFSMSQPTFSKCLHEVIMVLNKPEILKRHIIFPKSRREREVIMTEFMNKFGFPGVIGCIDGTHVALVRPVDHEETYFNRKHYHSLNVLIICDSNLRIMHVDASYGGAAHDSFVWNQSPLEPYLRRLHRNGESCWLLGDSGYAQRPWMMTPILGASESSPEEHYTNLHCRVRNTVERCIGVLKSRWRCLLAHRVLHYDPVTAAKIVNACVVLHNIAIAHNTPIPDSVDSDAQQQINSTTRLFNLEDVPDNARQRLVRRLSRMRRSNDN